MTNQIQPLLDDKKSIKDNSSFGDKNIYTYDEVMNDYCSNSDDKIGINSNASAVLNSTANKIKLNTKKDIKDNLSEVQNNNDQLTLPHRMHVFALVDKIEKISAAIFMITEHILDQDDIKLSLRENAISSVKAAAQVKDMHEFQEIMSDDIFAKTNSRIGNSSTDKNSLTNSDSESENFAQLVISLLRVLRAELSSAVSMLKLLHNTGMISSQNFEIIFDQIKKSTLAIDSEVLALKNFSINKISENDLNDNLSNSIDEIELKIPQNYFLEDVEHKESILSKVAPNLVFKENTDSAVDKSKLKDFYETEKNSTESSENSINVHKTQIGSILSLRTKDRIESHKNDQNIEKDTFTANSGKIEKDNREELIINYVKFNQGAQIKDIQIALPGVGEKTVQRMLLSMVSRNILRKEGERRWSKYSVA